MKNCKYLSKIKLREIINIKSLQEMQNKFAKATGLSSLIVDAEGNWITYISNYKNYCKLIRSTPIGQKRCTECDIKIGKRAAETKNIAWHFCHAGLVDVSAPIIIDGIFLGHIMCGQVLFKNPSEYDLENVKRISRELSISYDLLEKYYKEINIVTKKHLFDCAQLLNIMGSYIIESGINALIQHELHEKKNQLMEVMASRADLEKTLKELELKTLQSQVNPHFLFNALNTIARLAMFENAQQTQEITLNLAELFRYSLRKIENPTTIADEVNYVNNYLTIQTQRFGERIRYKIKVDPEVMNFKLPAMTLQPLVENSIIHGLEPKIKGGVINISIKKEDDKWLTIIIVDTGMGISKDRIEKIFKGEIQGTGRSHSTGIGLTNVHKRLMHFFNNNCDLKIKSMENYWTKITIRLPYS